MAVRLEGMMDEERQPEAWSDIALSLALKGLDVQLAAFDAVDAKASSAIGYISVAGTLLGFVAAGGQNSLPVKIGLSLGMVFIVFAVGLALKALQAKDVLSFPSATQTRDYLDYYGAAKTASEIIPKIENAQDVAFKATNQKCQLLHWSYISVFVGLVAVVVAVVIRVLAGVPQNAGTAGL